VLELRHATFPGSDRLASDTVKHLTTMQVHLTMSLQEESSVLAVNPTVQGQLNVLAPSARGRPATKRRVRLIS